MTPAAVFTDLETDALRQEFADRPLFGAFLQEALCSPLATRNHRHLHDPNAFSVSKVRLVKAFGTRDYQWVRDVLFECMAPGYSRRGRLCKTYRWTPIGLRLACFHVWRDVVVEYRGDAIDLMLRIDPAAITALREHPERYTKADRPGACTLEQIRRIADRLARYQQGEQVTFRRSVSDPWKPRFLGPGQTMPSAVRHLAFPGCIDLDMQASQPRILNWLVGGRFSTLAELADDPVGMRENVAAELGCPGHGKALTQGLFFGQGLRTLRSAARKLGGRPDSAKATRLHADVQKAFEETLGRAEHQETLRLSELHVLKSVTTPDPPFGGDVKAWRRWHEVRNKSGSIVEANLQKVVRRTAIAFILQHLEERAFRVGLNWLETVFPGMLRLPLHDGWIIDDDDPEFAQERADLIQAHIRHVTGMPVFVKVKALFP